MADNDLLGGGSDGDDAAVGYRGTQGASSVEAGAVLATVEAVAETSAGEPRLPREAADYYVAQKRLVEVQTDHLSEQRAWQLSQLRVQVSHLRLRRFTDRLRAGIQVLIIAAFAVVGLALAIMLYDAFSSRGVVIEPFSAPPALAARGLSGSVVANGLLDRLVTLQNATMAQAVRRNVSGAWRGDVKIEVPQTGVSIGDLNRALRRRFGHDVHIDGDLVQTTTDGLALSVRGDGVPPRTFTGGAGDLDKLTAAAAEYVYGASEPGLYVAWLVTMNRNAEAIAFARAEFGTADATERPYLLNSWANALQQSGGSARASLDLYRAALSLKPDFLFAWSNVMNALIVLGDEEGAWRAGTDMRKANGSRPGGAKDLGYQNWDYLTWDLGAWRKALDAAVEENATTGGGLPAAGPDIADVDVRLHDWRGAALHLQLESPDSPDPSIGAISHFVSGRIATAAGDPATAATEMEAFGRAYFNPIVSSGYPGYDCWIAPAEEAAGRRVQADAVLQRGGRHVDCRRFAADILDGRGDWAGAQRAYAAAVALAPDLPSAYYSWDSPWPGMAISPAPPPS